VKVRHDKVLPWLYLAPSLLVLVVVALYPLYQTFHLSFTDSWAGDPEPGRWIGLGNYRELLGERDFWDATRNTVLFTVISVGLEFLLGLAIALIINANFRWRGTLRATVLLPWALPTVVAARLWGWMLHDQYGVLNDLVVYRLGIVENPIAWTGTSGWAMAAVIAADVWKTTPFVALLLLAGLQVIPRELYEAAEVDGATWLQVFRRVCLPLLKPAILVALVFRTLDALRVFDIIWVMTQGRFQTESLGTYAYRQLFDFSRLGYGSAVSVMLFLLVAVFVIAYTRMLKVEEH
jgi:trehalose/maltose transport system permease protein